MALDWREIDGWLSEEEGNVLAVLAAGKIVLEIGSWKGRSTCCMAQTASAVWAVDHHQGDQNTGPADTEQEFVANIAACGVVHKIDRLRGSIESVYPSLLSMFRQHHHAAGRQQATTPGFGMAFVDAAHDAGSVERHTRYASSLLAPGGILAWHDYDQSDVRKGIAAAGFAPTSFAGSLAWQTV